MRRKGSDLLIDLAGKDFFTAEEAAVYCGISLDRWRKAVEPHIQPGLFMGQTVYRRGKLKDFIDRSAEWKNGPPWDWAALEESRLPKKLACRKTAYSLAPSPTSSMPVPATEMPVFTEQDLRRVAIATAEVMLARRPVPRAVTLKQAAEMLCISTATARKLQLRRDATGLIPYENVLAARNPK